MPRVSVVEYSVVVVGEGGGGGLECGCWLVDTLPTTQDTFTSGVGQGAHSLQPLISR